ncbi:hypothetical protein ACJMK2_000274 [Sinanodonta woodiana]|uniref:Uncharacterized protein n=1 Tax=Sinanodonta woodiana TaxID=1069815 RepID=A0ABD3XP11_SINWO
MCIPYPTQNEEYNPTPMIRGNNFKTHNIHMQMSQLAIQKQKENQMTPPEDTTDNTTATETTDNTYTKRWGKQSSEQGLNLPPKQLPTNTEKEKQINNTN